MGIKSAASIASAAFDFKEDLIRLGGMFQRLN